MISRRAWARAAAGVLAMLAVLPAAAQSLDKIKARGTLVVGVKNDYKPWGFLDPSGKIVGLEIDLAQDIADKIGVKLELVPVIAANRMEFLEQGRIDMIIATMGDTEQRRQVVGMIDPDYYAGGTNVLASKSAHLTDWQQLRGKRVCAVQGAYYNRSIAEHYSPQLIVFPAVPEALNALQNGNCIAFLFDDTLIQSTLAGGDPKWGDYEMPLTSEDEQGWAIAVPLTERDGPYGKLISEMVIDWHKSGKLIALEKKWGIAPSPFLQEMHKKYS